MKFEGIYCFGTASVRFAVYPDGYEETRVLASVKVDILRDYFGVYALEREPLEVCRANYGVLEKAAVARFRKDPHSPIDLQLFELNAASRITPGALQPSPIEIVAQTDQAHPSDVQWSGLRTVATVQAGADG